MYSNRFDAFYNRFVLRDFLAKIVPGLIVVLSMSTAIRGVDVTQNNIEKLPIGGWILVFGVGWLSGLAIQSLGEVLSLINYYPKPKWVTLSKKNISLTTWRAAHNDIRKMHDAKEIRSRLVGVTFASDDEWNDFWFGVEKCCKDDLMKYAERMVIIKEACGNAGVALLAVLFIFLITQATSDTFMQMDTLYGFLSLGLPSFLLCRMHFVHVRRQCNDMTELASVI